MSLYQLLLILRARKWIVFAALAVGVVAALAVNILMPKQYTATATVVVDSVQRTLARVRQETARLPHPRVVSWLERQAGTLAIQCRMPSSVMTVSGQARWRIGAARGMSSSVPSRSIAPP